VKKGDTILSIIIVVMFVLVVICTVRTGTIGQRLSEIEAEQLRPCNVSVSVTCAPTLPLRARAINLTKADIGQDRLQVNSQPELSIDSEDTAYTEICVARWLEDAFTVREI
jgi:hypothetical protein